MSNSNDIPTNSGAEATVPGGQETLPQCIKGNQTESCIQPKAHSDQEQAPHGVSTTASDNSSIFRRFISHRFLKDEDERASVRMETTLASDRQISTSSYAGLSPKRSVSKDYPIPPWIYQRKFLDPKKSLNLQYTKTFIGKYGIVNFGIAGCIEDPLILCFHGLNASKVTFHDIQTICARHRFCVVAFDFYGHGLSANPKYRVSCIPKLKRRNISPKAYSVEFFAEQAEEILCKLQLQHRRLSLIGFSMGGVVAGAFAARHLDLIDRLVLISTAGYLGKKKPVIVRCISCCRCCIPVTSLCICRCCFDKETFIKRFPKQDVDNGFAEMMWKHQIWQLFVKKNVTQSFLGSLVGVPLWNALPIFKQVGKTGLPVLILWGKKDNVAPVESSVKIKACFPNSHLIIFQQGTHVILADQATQVIACILAFLKFPPFCDMSKYKQYFPFSETGEYVPQNERYLIQNA